MSKIVNLFGAPGSGKSTIAAGLFYELKLAGYSAELINEYAKSKVWSEDKFTLENQAYVTIKQYYMQDRPNGKVQCIITDSPILLGLFYQRKGCTPSFKPYMLELFHQYNNINFLLKMSQCHRNSYSEMGRLQTYDESIQKEAEIESFLIDNGIEYVSIEVNGRSTLETLKSHVEQKLTKPKMITFE